MPSKFGTFWRTTFPSRVYNLLLLLILLAVFFPYTVLAGRLCGKALTNELSRVCTKEGMKGSCVHGADNFATLQKRSSFGPWRLLDRLDGPSKTNVRNLFDLLSRKGGGGGTNAFVRRPFYGDSHGFMRLLRRFDDSVYARPKRPIGIANKCCSSAEGCDAAFLEKFCCNEAEEKTFREVHKI